MFKGCRCNATYGYDRINKLMCFEHKLEGMKLCTKLCYCGKQQPIYNTKRGLKPVYCSKCKKEGMIDVISPMCIICDKVRPIFNYKSKSKPEYCANCKKEGMIDVVSKRCECGKIRTPYNYSGNKTGICCSKCKKEGMIDVQSKRCPNCDTGGNVFSLAKSKYKGYCAKCFQHLFPNDPKVLNIRQKTKEIKVRDFINSNFEGFVHDKPLIYGGCDCTHRRRIDHRKNIGGTLLCIETDENQHKWYNESDEQQRYNDIMVYHGGKAVFIRFNPDKYIDSKSKPRNPNLKIRLEMLGNVIKEQITRIERGENHNMLEIIKLYYDGFT